jgi:hypothetical protein
MSHPRSEPVREQPVNRAAVPRVELFSHPPQAEAFAQRPLWPAEVTASTGERHPSPAGPTGNASPTGPPASSAPRPSDCY